MRLRAFLLPMILVWLAAMSNPTSPWTTGFDWQVSGDCDMATRRCDHELIRASEGVSIVVRDEPGSILIYATPVDERLFSERLEIRRPSNEWDAMSRSAQIAFIRSTYSAWLMEIRGRRCPSFCPSFDRIMVGFEPQYEAFLQARMNAQAH